MKKLIHTFLLLVACTISLQLSAQLTQNHLDPDAEFKNAKDLYQKEQFSLAYPVFKKLYSNGISQSNMPDLIKLESKYYYIICGLQLNDEATVAKAQDFIELENNTARVQMMSYHLGEYYYRKKRFPQRAEILCVYRHRQFKQPRDRRYEISPGVWVFCDAAVRQSETSF
jgi:hypothetical protein